MKEVNNSGTKSLLSQVNLSGKRKDAEKAEVLVKRSYDIKESTEMMLKELLLKEYYPKDKKVTLGQVVDEAIRYFCEMKKGAE